MGKRTPISRAVFILRLLSFLPSGKSTLRDKIGLLFWTGLASCVTFTNIYLNLEVAIVLLGQHSVYSLFGVLQKFIVPGCQIIATVPALYHLISHYPHIVEENLLSSPRHPLIFSVNIILCIFSCSLTVLGTVEYFKFNMFSASMALAQTILFFGVQILTFFMIGICMDQMRKTIENDCTGIQELKGITKKMGSKILRDYGLLKEGIAPLLLVIFSSNSLNMIAFSAAILIVPNWSYGATIVFFIWDLFYITIAIDKTFEALQVFILELR